MNFSHQREVILDYLKGTKNHPTAEEVYNHVRKENPKISLGTVYRNLNLLAENNIILRLHMENGIDHFDADTSIHHHFYCKKCGRVYDIELPLEIDIQKLTEQINSKVNFLADGCMIYFYGTCSNCQKK